MSKRGEHLFDGIKGETVFIKPFLDYYAGLENNTSLVELFKKLQGNGDHRSLTIISALIIEHNIDRVLSIIFPRYSALIDKQKNSLTFSFKTEILRAFSLIPKHILESVDCVRNIRNEFAHNLELDKIDLVKNKSLQHLRQLFVEIYQVKQVESLPQLEDMFNQIAFIAISGIRLYEPNIKILREKIDDPEFMQSLQNLSKIRFDEAIGKIKSTPPTETKFENELEIKKYKDGYTQIGGVE